MRSLRSSGCLLDLFVSFECFVHVAHWFRASTNELSTESAALEPFSLQVGSLAFPQQHIAQFRSYSQEKAAH
jgi:hypothetical protein